MPRLDNNGIQVTGLRETVRDLEAMGVEVDDLKEAFTAIAQDVADEAGANLAAQHVINTGALAKSIRPAKAKNKAVVRAGSSRAWYARIVNGDKRGRRGAGFLTDPANAHLPERIDRIVQALNDLAAKHGSSPS